MRQRLRMPFVCAGALIALGAAGCSPSPEHDPAPTVSTAGAARIGFAVDLSRETTGAEPRALVPLAGHWRVVDDAGEKTVVVDGRQWTPGVPPLNLTIKSTALFPDISQVFAERVRRAQSYPLAVARDIVCFGSGIVSTDFKLIAGESDQYAAIAFGLGADANFLALRYNTKDGDLALWRVVDGERRRLHHGGTPVQLSLGTWHTLRLDVSGPVVIGSIDDQRGLEFELPHAPRGRLGYWTKPDSVTAFRNFTWTPRAEHRRSGIGC